MLEKDKIHEINSQRDDHVKERVVPGVKYLNCEVVDKDILNMIPVGISQVKIVRDKDGRIERCDHIYSNDKFAELAGCNYYKDTFESVIASLDQYFLRGKYGELDKDSYDYEYNNKEDDKYIHVSRYVDPEQCIITDVINDITNIKKTNSRIKMYNDLFYSVLANVEVGVEMYDKNNTLLFMNKYGLNMFGLPDQSVLLGSNLLNNPIIPKTVLTEIDKNDIVEFNTNCDFGDAHKRAYYRTNYDGNISFNAKIISVRNRCADLEYRIMFVNNAFEFDKCQNRITELESIIRKSYFELRTHLNVILGFSELLKDDLVDRDKKEEYYMIVKESSNQLLNMLSDDVEIV